MVSAQIKTIFRIQKSIRLNELKCIQIKISKHFFFFFYLNTFSRILYLKTGDDDDDDV